MNVMSEMGLVTHDHRLLWGWKHGFGRGWVPHRILHTVVAVWNPIACRIWDHDWHPDWGGDGVIYWADERFVYHNSIAEEVCSACSAVRPCRPEWRDSVYVDWTP